MSTCRVCQAEIEPILDFGQMPIANGFLTADQFATESFFDLRVGFCPRCTMVQLIDLVDRERMFHDHYAFFSSTSVRMTTHFRQLAEDVRTRCLTARDPLVVEIGSNDGILLQHFAATGVRHLGIEPSANVAEVARQKGIRTISRFFDEALAREIVAEHGQAAVFLAANVMCHLPDLHSVAEGVRLLLKRTGRLVFEDPYLGDIIHNNAYDQIYDEHAFYFSLQSVSRLFLEHGLDVVDVQPQPVHGGSMRYVLAHRGACAVAGAVTQLHARERELGLDTAGTFRQFRDRVARSRTELRRLLGDLKQQRQRVAGYAATSKSTTVINYCGVTPDLLQYISDTTPIKQGKFSPGAHIPIRAHAEFQSRYPDYAVLFGWNHAAEIFAKEQAFTAQGGRWIVYVPEVRVLA